ncbi:MAG: hypothetical protein LBE36_14285 [Flavobacteriaceae bacterium]|jgi:hypothetical protein|nr:hypothetical protein [Flavobacteriaceae bacterium]
MIKKIARLLTIDFYHRKYIQIAKRFFPEYYQRNSFYFQLQEEYYWRTKKRLSYCFPQDINEKLYWLSRYWQHPLVSKCSDKYLVREYVKNCGCEKILVPLIGVYDDANEIDFDVLPNQFVLKCNHGYAYNILCQDKTQLNKEQTILQLNEWLSRKFGKNSPQPHYENIESKIICEKFLDISGNSLIDYKIHCFNGKPDFFLICSEREHNSRSVVLTSYSLEWEKLSLLKKEGKNSIPKPELLTEMIEYAKVLSKPFPYVRVDLYYVNHKIYFGELTFTPAANLMPYYTDETLKMMGKKLKLPKKIKLPKTIN